MDFSVPIHLQDLSGSGKYIGASAVQGRKVYDHKCNEVLRSVQFTLLVLLVLSAVAEREAGTTKVTVNAGNFNTTLTRRTLQQEPSTI